MSDRDRITRDLTPMVEVVTGPAPPRSRLVLQTEAGALFEEDGRAVFKMPGPTGRPIRILVDPDIDLYELVCGTSPGMLSSVWEIQTDRVPEPLPRELRGATLVLPYDTPAPMGIQAAVAQTVPAGNTIASRHVDEVHINLGDPAELPTAWPNPSPPICVNVPISGSESTDVLPELLHGMGSGRLPVREVRLRINPRLFQIKDRRPPFLSEVVEAVAASAGCSTSQLGRELALRGRLVGRGLRRHLLPDPYFVTWIFRGHKTRGLLPATDHFPVPRRASRQEILRGTPESEHERLLSYLSLLEDSRPRLRALADRNLFAVSAHFLPNPDLPMFPNHGGICRWHGGRTVPLG